MDIYRDIELFSQCKHAINYFLRLLQGGGVANNEMQFTESLESTRFQCFSRGGQVGAHLRVTRFHGCGNRQS